MSRNGYGNANLHAWNGGYLNENVTMIADSSSSLAEGPYDFVG